MRINLASVLVDDQAKALRFYTDVLGFVKKNDVPMGEHRWLTVVSPEQSDGVELLLEPDAHPAAGRSRTLSSPTASPLHRSRSTTRTGSTNVSPVSVSRSPSRRRRWVP